MAASINIVELGFRDTVIDINGLDEESSLLGHHLESVNTSGGLLRDTVDAGDHLAPLLGVASLELATEDAEHLLHLKVVSAGGVWECSELLKLLLGLDTFVHEESGITTIVNENIGTVGIGPCEHLESALPVLLEVLTLPGEDVGGLGGNDTCGGVVLGGVDVARCPSDLRSESVEGLNENTSLDGHVERSRDAGAFKGLVVLVFFTESHETWHLNLGEFVFTTAEGGEAHILDFRLEAVGVDTVVSVDHLFVFSLRRVCDYKSN